MQVAEWPRRTVLKGLAASPLLLAMRRGALAGEAMQRLHAISLIDRIKYPPDFKNFDWVNPKAPKGGRLRYGVEDSFDSLNPYSVKGQPAPATNLFLDHSLMTQSIDEPATVYCQIAEWVAHSADISVISFGVRKEARFSDGKPITVDDVIFSFTELKRVSPLYNQYFKNVVAAEQTGESEVTFRADIKGNREMASILGDLLVVPKHYWTGTGADGQKRDLGNTTLEPPIGSGPYRIAKVDPGRSITYERIRNHWAEALPVNVGHFNFDEIRFEMFHDATAMFESFKSGALDFHREVSAKNWYNSYRFPAIDKGLIKREEIRLGGSKRIQGLVLNQRRKLFTDRRIRRALAMLLDFDWLNKYVLFGLEERSRSFFQGTEISATGKPKGRELEILRKLVAETGDVAGARRGIDEPIPDWIFGENIELTTDFGYMQARDRLAAAARLMKEAGYEIRGGEMVLAATGTPFRFELMIDDASKERFAIAYQRWLKQLGIGMNIRLVDGTQFISRLQSFDFDATIVYNNMLLQSESPGNEQRDFWGTAAADKLGSSNYAGSKNPAVDKLVEWLVVAQTREEVVEVSRALDRLLLAQQYIILLWHSPSERVAYWDRLGRPEKLPSLSTGLFKVWWYDEAAARRLKEKVQS